MSSSQKRQLGTKAAARPGSFVQTERAAHEAWAQLIGDAPSAARLGHVIVASMGQDNAVVASQSTLAAMAGMSVATVKRAVKVLVDRRWIEVVKLGGKGGALAYIVNDRVAWARRRDEMPVMSRFSAQVIASADEQTNPDQLGNEPPLRRIPVVMRGETPLPEGPGEAPPAQQLLEGTEPVVETDEQGQRWAVYPSTGEARLIGHQEDAGTEE